MTHRNPNTTLTCPNCGTQREAYVRPSTPKVGFCNPTCQGEYKTKTKLNPRKYKNCLQCNAKLTKKTQIKFCNRSCSAMYSNHHRKISGWKSPQKLPRKKCLLCDKKVKTPNARYCGQICGRKAGSITQRKYKTDEERIEAKRKNKLYHQIKREAMKRERCTTDENELKEIKEFIDNCPEGHQIDHIIPISKGGWHKITNLQYLTIRENICKNNKLPCEWTLYRLKMWKVSPYYFNTDYTEPHTAPNVANMTHIS